MPKSKRKKKIKRAPTGKLRIVVDRTGRKELIVVPRQFSGHLLHNLTPAETVYGDIYLELYLSDPAVSNQVAKIRN